MRVLLIDADSTIPNLALMKLSTHYKSIGWDVDLLKLNIQYYPNRKNQIKEIETIDYDQILCSVIFPRTLQYIKGDNIEYGGTGYSLEKTLPTEIECLEPDYSIYPENTISYGFITRGCIRNCYFCYVPKKEGSIRKVNEIENIVRHKKVKFMDNNILAYQGHKKELSKIVELGVRCQFNQGLDIRLLDKENSVLLSKLNYIGEYIFAFDDWKYRNIIDKKLELMLWRKDWQLKFFIYVNPEMPIADTINRIKYLHDKKCLPYIMRDLTCWDSPNKDFYTDIASWCNQPQFFKKMTFGEFLNRRTKNKNRIERSLKLYNQLNITSVAK